MLDTAHNAAFHHHWMTAYKWADLIAYCYIPR
jgi:hypothetical protein